MITNPICNWCGEEPGQGLVLTTESKKNKDHVTDHVICASCGLKAIHKSLGKPKKLPITRVHADKDCPHDAEPPAPKGSRH